MNRISIPSAPGALPLAGHAIPLMRDPLGFLSSLPDRGNLVTIRMGRTPVVVACDSTLIHDILTDDRKFDKGGPWFDRARETLGGTSLPITPYSSHRRLRRLYQPAFHVDRLPAYAATFVESALAVSESWHEGQVINVREETTKLTARASVAVLFGSSLAPGAAKEATDELMTYMSGVFRRMVSPQFFNRLPTPANRRFTKSSLRLRQITREVSTSPRGNGVDLLSALVAAADPELSDGSPMFTQNELEDQVLSLFIAGTDTTANTIAWALHLLGGHPGIEERLHTEIDRVLKGTDPSIDHLPSLTLTGNIVAETLRLYPPGWFFTRITTVDCELGGYHLPAGTVVACSPYIVHHRADAYESPEHFDPDRWSQGAPRRADYIPFSAGPRKCAGDRFAVTEATLALATIASRWQLRPADGNPVRASAKATLAPRRLSMRLTARRPQSGPRRREPGELAPTTAAEAKTP